MELPIFREKKRRHINKMEARVAGKLLAGHPTVSLQMPYKAVHKIERELTFARKEATTPQVKTPVGSSCMWPAI